MHGRELLRPDLSVIVPMYNEAGRIRETFADLARTLSAHSWRAEVVLVDDGSTDSTRAVVRTLIESVTPFDLVTYRLVEHGRNRGKGAAVRTGLAETSGRWRLMMDADNAARLVEVTKLFEAAARSGAGLVAGSRSVAGAEVDAQPIRKLTGILFKLALAGMGLALLRDTQCGFKLYRGDLANLLATHAVEDGFAFDLEHLLLARRAGLRLDEVGVRWQHRVGGQINPVLDGLKMLGQAARIRLRRYRGIPSLGDAAWDASRPVACVRAELA
ncbi:MAG: glycosyltransferase [Phycisphaerales bacterium]